MLTILRCIVVRSICATVLSGSLAAAAILFGVASFAAEAGSETRSLTLFDWQSREKVEIVFKRDGVYDEAGLRELNEFLRDRRSGKSIVMDPRLFDGLWEFYRQSGSRYPVYILSGYRERLPFFNKYAPELRTDMLSPDAIRRLTPLEKRMKLPWLPLHAAGIGVVTKTQHQLGRAVDFFMADVPPSQVEEILRGMKLGKVRIIRGGNTPRIHFDISDTGG